MTESKYRATLYGKIAEGSEKMENVHMNISDFMGVLYEPASYLGHSVTVNEIKKTEKGFVISGLVFEHSCFCPSFWSCGCPKYGQKKTFFNGEFIKKADSEFVCNNLRVYR